MMVDTKVKKQKGFQVLEVQRKRTRTSEKRRDQIPKRNKTETNTDNGIKRVWKQSQSIRLYILTTIEK
jgi:hypothetical protein